MKNAIGSSDCRGVFTSDQQRMLLKVYGLLDYMCIDRLEDIIKHQECFLAARLEDKMNQCISSQGGQVTCDSSRLISCMNNAMNSQPKCSAGAKQLVADLIRKTVGIMPGCSGLKFNFKEYINKMFMELLK